MQLALLPVLALPLRSADGQPGSSAAADPIGPVFRAVIDSVASTAGLASLRDAALPSGTAREIRAYLGFGLGGIHQAVRI